MGNLFLQTEIIKYRVGLIIW